jgi:hypothetical protein
VKKVFRYSSYTFAILLVCSSIILWRLSTLSTRDVELENFTFTNKVEIYALGLLMGLTAYPIYPEIAQAHLSLYFPKVDTVKHIEDDFFLRSQVVKNAIEKALSTGKPSYLAWPASAYTLSFNQAEYWEARVALALNGGWLNITGDVATATIDWKYPRNSLAPLFRLPLVGLVSVQEGLFWILQEEKWLFPGRVEWTAKIDDR